MSYYLDENGNPKSELLDKQAHQTAEHLVKVQEIKANQLRKFYNDCKAMERKYLFVTQQLRDQDISETEAKKIALQRIYARLKMLKSKAEYASNPKNPKIPNFFKNWLIKGIDEVNPNEPRDFEAFLLHFEAVVGFCYGIGLRNNC
jgi:CRISPR-associated protein Csm2